MVFLKTTLGPKGQIVIPKPIRKDLNLKTGDTLILDDKNNTITIKIEDKGEEFVKNLLSIVSDSKKTVPKKEIDWDSEYYSQVK